jgi:hypothetical protein
MKQDEWWMQGKPGARSQKVEPKAEDQNLEPQRTQRSAEEKPFLPQIFTDWHRFKSKIRSKGIQ